MTQNSLQQHHAAEAGDQSSLSARLRQATLVEHAHAEKRPFIMKLMGGDLVLADYARYLAQLSYVYEVLEARAVHPNDLPLTRDERLHRFGSITADLAELGVSNRELEHPPLAATRDYLDRIRSALAPEAFLAHHYTRYLGDLSGGQVVAAMIARHYGATPAQLSFARFDQLEKPVLYKREYRAMIDALVLDQEQEERLLSEARAAYLHNSALFDALDR